MDFGLLYFEILDIVRLCEFAFFWILRVLNSWGLEISGLLDLWALFFGVLRILRLWIFGPFVF